MRRLCLVFAFLAAGVFSAAQDDNTFHVKQFKGATVADRLTAAMAACSSNPAEACHLVIDSSLGAFASGTMPALCANCVLDDRRLGAGTANSRSFNTARYASMFSVSGSGLLASPWVSASGSGGICEAIADTPEGGTVFLPSGYYSITTSCVITKPVHVVGYGRALSKGTVLLVDPAATGAVFLLQPTSAAVLDGFSFQNIVIIAASGSPAMYGIELDGTNAKILDGVISEMYISLGLNAIYAIGTGGAQGTPVLTTIRDNVLFGGGLSCVDCGDSVKVDHNQIGGTGQSSFTFQAGAAGFKFYDNNVTPSGGVHIGQGAVNPYIGFNDTQTLGGFTGSNGAMFDLDGAAGGDGFNIRNAMIEGNTFAVAGGAVALRMNYTKFSTIRNNEFGAAAAGGCDISITANSLSDSIGTNWFYTPSATLNRCGVLSGTGVFYQGAGVSGAAMTFKDNQPLSSLDSSGDNITPYDMINAHAGIVNLYSYHNQKGLVLNSGSVSIYDGGAAGNLAFYIADGAVGTPNTATWGNAANLRATTALQLDYESTAATYLACFLTSGKIGHCATVPSGTPPTCGCVQ